MVPLVWRGLQCQWMRLIVSIVFVLFDANSHIDHIDRIDCIDCIDRINSINSIDCINSIDSMDHVVLSYNALQTKDISNHLTNSGTTFWGKKEEPFYVTGIYWHLQIFYEFYLRNIYK